MDTPGDIITEAGQRADIVVIQSTTQSVITKHDVLGKAVVVKSFKEPYDARTIARWRNEVSVLRKLNAGCNVSQLLDASDVGTFSISFLFEEGQSLDRHTNHDHFSTLSNAECYMVLDQITHALAHLHSLSIVHDDVKPENIVWCPERRRAVLIDFGAAIDLEIVPRHFFTFSGTPSYSPPEYMTKKKGVQGDVWALGVVMLFALLFTPLPDGTWFLPGVFQEGPGRRDMLAWHERVGQLRMIAAESHPLLGLMLDPDPEARIGILAIRDYMTSKNSFLTSTE